MKLWHALYAMIWVVFLEFLLVMTPDHPEWVTYVHVVAGLVIAGLAFYNFSHLRTTVVPGRIKRVAKSTVQLSVLMAILGLFLLLRFGETWVIPLINVSIYGLILFIHVVNAFAIITQAAAVAIAYDMWEEKEFAKETAPGEIPTMPVPKPGAAFPKT